MNNLDLAREVDFNVIQLSDRGGRSKQPPVMFQKGQVGTICLIFYGASALAASPRGYKIVSSFWAFFFGLAGPRGYGETLPRTRFTPSALDRRSLDPNRIMLEPFLGFVGPCRIRSTFKGGCVFGSKR